MIFFLYYGKIFLSFEIIFLFDRLLSVFRLQAFRTQDRAIALVYSRYTF